MEYQIDSGSFTTLDSNLSVSADSSNTSMTYSVKDGETITWRITDSFTSNDFTNMTAETQTTSDAVDCDPALTISSSFGSCVGNSKVSSLVLTSGEGAALYVKVSIKLMTNLTKQLMQT